MIALGKTRPGSTLRIPFGSFAASTGAPSGISGGSFAASDIQIYKDGNTTQRASASGITVTTDFDTLTGINLITIDLSDDTTAGFYGAGSEYFVVVSDITVDGQTLRFPIARFVIGIDSEIAATTIATVTSQTILVLTAGSADNNAYVGCPVYIHKFNSAVQCCMGVVSAYTGSTLTLTLAADPAIYTITAKDSLSIFPRQNAYAVGGLVVPSGAIPAAVAGAAGGLFIAGTNAATSITTALTANITGTISTVTSVTNRVTANVDQLDGASLSTHATGMIPADLRDIAGAAVSTTTAQLGVNAVQINAVSTSSVTTINANQGTTQPVNFTGTGASALAKSDMVDVAGAAVSTSVAQLGVNAVQFGGAAVTATTSVTIPAASTLATTTGAVGSVTSGVTVTTNNDKTGYSLTATTGLGNQTANLTGNVSGSVGSVTSGVTVTTNNDKTGYALTTGERTSIADALLDRDMSLGADNGSTTVRTMRQALRWLRNKWTISAGTLTVTKEDDATTSWTATVSTDAAALPVVGNDPAGP